MGSMSVIIGCLDDLGLQYPKCFVVNYVERGKVYGMQIENFADREKVFNSLSVFLNPFKLGSLIHHF